MSEEFRNVGRVRRALASAAIYRAISQLVGAVTYVLLIRLMTEYDYGIYSLFYSVPAVLGAVLSLGLGNALTRFLPEYFANKNYALVRHFVRWTLWIRLLTISLFIALCLTFWDQIAPIFDIGHLRSTFLIFVAILLTHFQCRILMMALSANLMQQWSSGLATGFAAIKLIGYLVASQIGVSLESILIADLVGYLAWYVGLRFAYQTKFPMGDTSKKIKFDKEERRRIFRYAAFYNFNDVGVVALKSTPDRLFIAAFLNPVAVGAYAFSTGLNAMIQKLTPVSFFNGVIEPMVFTLDYPRQRKRATAYFQFLVKINYLVQFPILVLVASAPEQIINVIFGGKFLQYANLLVAAFAFPALYCFQGPVTIMAQLGERAGIILASKIFAPYNVVAVIVLIPIMGVYGAIVATGTAQLFKSLFVWYFVREVASFRGTGIFFLTQILMWTICLVLARTLIGEFSDLAGLAIAAVLVGLFALAGLRLARFNNQESEFVRKVIGDRRALILERLGVIQ